MPASHSRHPEHNGIPERARFYRDPWPRAGFLLRAGARETTEGGSGAFFGPPSAGGVVTHEAAGIDCATGSPVASSPDLAPAATRPRDRTLDLLRGYFLVVIVVDHLHAFPSLFEVFTGRGRMWASAAEGFFLVSGFFVGRLRGEDARERGFTAVWAKILPRAFTLYASGVVLTLIFTFAGRAFGHEPGFTHGISHDPALRVVREAVLLRYTYGLADMLPVWAVLLLLSPVSLFFLLRGWPVALLTVSVGTWVVGLLSPQPLCLTASYFSEISWQLLFVVGIMLGYDWAGLQDGWHRLAPKTRLWLCRGLALAAGVTLVLSWLDAYAGAFPATLEPTLERAFHQVRLGPGRLAVSLTWIAFLWMWVKRHEERVLRWAGPFLEPLGRNSLYVYIVHSLLCFLCSVREAVPLWKGTLLDASVLVVIWMMVRFRVLFGLIPR